MPTAKETFESKMNALAASINTKAGTSGAKDLDDLKSAVDSISTGGAQPQLNAPTISISGETLTISNPSTNGNFVTSYDIYVDNVQTYNTANTTYSLSEISADTATITVKAKGTNFQDSAASASATYYKYFTVNMYDDDQTTLLSTENVRYGLMPTYSPTKTGYTFEYWTDINGTQVTEITANTNLYAVWEDDLYIRAGIYQLKSNLPTMTIQSSEFSVPLVYTFVNKDDETLTGEAVRIANVGSSSSNVWWLTSKASAGMTSYYGLAQYNSGWTIYMKNDHKITVATDQVVTAEEKANFETYFNQIS